MSGFPAGFGTTDQGASLIGVDTTIVTGEDRSAIPGDHVLVTTGLSRSNCGIYDCRADRWLVQFGWRGPPRQYPRPHWGHACAAAALITI